MMYPELDTPAVLADIPKIKENLLHMQAVADRAGVTLRPHIKTHKSTEIAKWQRTAGASGITAAKLSEAERMAAAGFEDILIAYPILGEHKLRRLMELGRRIPIKTVTDSMEVAEGLSQAGIALGREVQLYVELDCGSRRCGLVPGPEANQQILEIHQLPYLSVKGLFTHAGHAYGAKGREEIQAIGRQEIAPLTETAMRLRGAGIPIEHISVGSTPTACTLTEGMGATEIRPGTYVFYDTNMIMLGLAEETQCALTVLTTVVSVPERGRAVVDAGSKTLTSDLCNFRPGYGMVKYMPSIEIYKLYEEHGLLRFDPDCHALRIGDRLEIIPNHCCPVCNLTDWLQGVAKGRFVRRIPVDCRGHNY